MTPLKRITISFLAALSIWLFFAWPIPRDMTSGISSASLNVEKGGGRAMISGDHLQFLYQFWLTGDTIRGHTPLFVNPYEFNVGNDADGAFRGTYYAPFSLFYTIGEVVGGRAFGYNFNQLVTVWLTFLFIWLLVRRFSRDEGASVVAAVVGTSLPYSWISMFDGSPTGLAMMWIPVLFWSLDILVAERKLWAGAMAGIAVCMAEADSHVFFFAILACPFWCVFSYLFHFPGRRPSWREVICLLRASLLLIVFLGVAAWLVWSIRHSIQDTTLVSTSRSIEEVRANSPILSGIVRLANEGEGRKIYVGGYLLALLTLGGLAFLRSRRREPHSMLLPLLPMILLGAAILGVILLSTGVMNPGGVRVWKVVTTLIPPYGMIRQPHKIYCAMPVLLALAAGILWPILLKGVAGRWRTVLLLALVVPLVWDYGRRIKPTVCILDREQGAFRAIADDAKSDGNTRPHLLSLPVWPGDSHYDSLNEYYISLYGLRMVNGYGGTVRESYRTNIFERLESMNVGSISDSQLDFLLQRGVGYLILHEDCFPEKVSPFPVGLTLESLLNHPRLKSIGKDGAMWSFKILAAARAEPTREKVSFMTYYFPARRFECEDLNRATIPLASVLSPSAFAKATADMKGRGRGIPSPLGGEGQGEGYRPNVISNGVRLCSSIDSIVVPPSLAPWMLPLSWLVRARGEGTVGVANLIGGVTNVANPVTVASREWTWTRIGIPAGAGTDGVGAVIHWEKGSVDLDSVILSAGDWVSPGAGRSVELPAACFFHAGYTDRTGQWVTLRAAYEPDSIVFYGPKLPLDPGNYRVTVNFDSPAPAGTQLGQFNVRWVGNENDHWAPVKQGAPARLRFCQQDNRPFFVAFEFLRAADIRIRSVVLTRDWLDSFRAGDPSEHAR